jgi:hypothetical protein
MTASGRRSSRIAGKSGTSNPSTPSSTRKSDRGGALSSPEESSEQKSSTKVTKSKRQSVDNEATRSLLQSSEKSVPKKSIGPVVKHSKKYLSKFLNPILEEMEKNQLQNSMVRANKSLVFLVNFLHFQAKKLCKKLNSNILKRISLTSQTILKNEGK